MRKILIGIALALLDARGGLPDDHPDHTSSRAANQHAIDAGFANFPAAADWSAGCSTGTIASGGIDAAGDIAPAPSALGIRI